ncbi:MAG: di-trans,poly-cis-decaprenylcistransferase [Elusimicrobia bacterium]|nr:di-trans,poly-cis-decaprenylcistransferase [Elusimicrobiota bacterium]
MDGNGRWARGKGWTRIFGHEHGRDSVREAVKTSGELGVKALSLFAFSTENWSRPKEEVEFLMRLFDRTLREETQEMAASNVRLRTSGDLSRFPAWLQETIRHSVETLSGNTGLILNLAVNYGGKQDILQAVNRLQEGYRIQDTGYRVTEEEFEKHLQTSGLPAVDLLIRTSAEQRISNFFLWQAAYAEFVFMDVYWPDFRRQHLLKAILEYQGRDRRFGNVIS